MIMIVRRVLLGLIFFVIQQNFAQSVNAPSGDIGLIFNLKDGHIPTYSVTYKNQPIVKESLMGIVLKNDTPLNRDFQLIDSHALPFNETWHPVLGEKSNIVNEYNELTIELLQNKTNRKMNIIFRVFNEGVAFRYDLPEQDELNHFIVKDELSEFNLTDNHKVFWIPGDYDSNEYAYTESLISEIDTEKLDYNNGIGAQGKSERFVVQSPLMLKSKNSIYLNIFEAAVINYPVMHLRVNTKNNAFVSQLVPNAYGDKAYLQTPFATPWRTIMVSDDARVIVDSKMILNLNAPSKIAETSWIKPIKYVGIWWDMHVGTGSWNYADKYHSNPEKLIPNGKHAANTKNTKRYIDFAKKHGFDAILIEGWNVGWEDWAFKWKENVFDFVTPYPDFDIDEITRYAKEKNIKIIMHHETSGSVSNYERRLDRAFDFMKKYGYESVKTGYVGKIIPRGELHDGQWMVNHFNYVVERAAEYKFMVNSHESSRPTGVHRTYPNYISAEAARGNEFNAWSSGNPPSHETILPFTRLLGGPMDYTPGIFEIKMSHYNPTSKNQVHTTLAKQLALYVTMYSPLQMAADLIENYEKYPDAFQFIKDVSVDWEDTKILEAEPGDYLTIARQTKGKDTWFLGAITDENPRKTTLKLDFLRPYTKYKAVIYEDAKEAHWQNNPKAYTIRTIEVDAKTKINLNLAAGGGTAISFFPID